MHYMAIVTGTIASSEVSGHLASSSIALMAVTINELTTQAIPSLMTDCPPHSTRSSRKARSAVMESAREMLSEYLMSD